MEIYLNLKLKNILNSEPGWKILKIILKNGSVDIHCGLCSQSDEISNEQFPDSQQHFLKCRVMLKEEPALFPISGK